MDLRRVVFLGFIATTVMTTIMRVSQALGKTRVDVPLILGLFFTPNRDRAKIYGVALNLLNGWVFAFLYAAVFQYLRRASWWFGLLLGVIHSLFVLVIGLPALPGVHPRMATDARGPEPTMELEPPGFLAMNYGRQTAIVTAVAHLVFGVIMGTFYKVKK